MKGNTQTINGLENPRYFNVTGHNVNQVTHCTFVFAGSSTSEHAMASPYKELIRKIQKHFGIAEDYSPETPTATQQYRNHISALNGFLAHCGKTIDSNVGTELGGQFEPRLREYLDAIDVAPRTKADRRTLLRTIRRLHQDTTPSRDAAATSPKPPTNLSAALRVAIAQTGLAPKTLAKQLGISPATLRRWLNGAHLNQRGFPSLRRLEHALGLERDALVSLAKCQDSSGGTPASKNLPSFRRRMAEMEPHGLTLPESELSSLFRQEWHGLFTYKCGGSPHLERTQKGTWRLIPAAAAGTLSEMSRRRNMVCPTADMFLGHLRRFFGVLFHLPLHDGGLAWAVPPEQTLAWLAQPVALALYLDWLTDRSEGLRHSGQRVFATFVASLVRPTTGYLWQQPGTFRERLAEGFRPADDESWRTMCRQSHAYLQNFMRNANDISRRPDEPIADLLALEQPLKPLMAALKLIDASAAACPPGSVSEARHKRDALLLALLLSNPLRARTIASLTWLPDGHGSVRGSPEIGWRIVLSPQQLKNGSSRRGQNYNVRVAAWLKPRLDAYLEEFRDTLLQGRRSPYLLVGDEDGNLWEGISRTVTKLTKKFIPNSPGFGPHAIRHLVATDWLRRYPGEFMTVSELLNDRLETVLSNYAHLKRDDSFARYEAHLEALM